MSIINYAGEEIPDSNEIYKNCKSIVDSISSKKRYKFKELFHNVNNEYRRNNKIWSNEILFNNWSNNDFEEVQKPQREQKKKNEVKGIYVFYQDDQPVYVGMSRKLLRRLKNHFIGKSHFEASLVYLISRHKHDSLNGTYKGNRKDLKFFIKDRESIQSEMIKNWSISILPIDNNYQMYLTEFLLACHLKSKWNTFETH